MPIVTIVRGENDENGNVVFIVTLSEAASDVVTLGYRTQRDSTADDDDLFYDALSGLSYNTLTFAPGETQKEISIFARGDSLDEVDEFFVLELFNLSANAQFSGGENTLQAVGIIGDDDGAGVNRALFVSDPKIVETDAGTKLAVFDIVLSDPAPSAFTATYTTVDGSATAGEDYAAQSGSVSFAVGQQTATVSVEVFGDENVESSEFFSLAVTPPSNPIINARAATGTGVILDNDGLSGPVISISDGKALENEYLMFTLSLSEAPLDAVTVQYRLVYDGSADDKDIFYDINDGRNYNTVTFAPGQTSTDIFVFVRGDSADETDEFFSIELFDVSPNASLAGGENTLQATAIISDDDGAGANTALHVTNPVIIEGDNGSKFAVFEVILSEPLSTSMVATYTTVDASATAGVDYVGETGTVFFAAGQSKASVAIEVIGDSAVELTEQFSLAVQPPSNLGINTRSAVGQATLLDDDANTGPVISISDAQASEGEPLRFSVTLSEPSFDAITVEYRSLFSSTADSADLFYDVNDGRVNNTLTFAPGETSKDIFIFPRDTSADEIDEFFSVELHNVTGNAELAGGEQTLRATATILDTDGLGNDAALHVSDPIIVEGDAGSKFAVFNIRLSQPASEDFVAQYTTADGSAVAGEDYEATAGAIAFSRGQQIASVAVEVFGDTASELSEQFSLVVSQSLVNGRGAVGEATIADDDSGPGPVITVADGIATEGEGLLFTITLSEPSLDAVSVSYRTIVTGSADNDDIFYNLNDGRNNGDVTFAPGQTSLDVVIFSRSDNADEADEFFSFELFGASENASLEGGAPTIRATGTILDNDGAGANTAMHVSNPVIVEGDGGARLAVFDIELSQPASGPFTAPFTTIDGTATAGEDYVARSGVIGFAAGQKTTSVIVELLGDQAVENSESFSLSVTPPTNPLVNASAAVGEAIIIDDDAGAGVNLPVISISGAVGEEGDVLQFTLTLSEASSEEVRVDITPLFDGTADSDDFFSSSGTTSTITVPPGVTSLVLFSSSRSDGLDERDEGYTLVLSDPVNAVLAGGESTLATNGFISDDDGVGLNVALAGLPTVLGENGVASQFFEIPIKLSQPVGSTLTFDVASIDGTAAAGSDFELIDTTVTFAPGQTEAAVLVRIIGDLASEGTEQFLLSFTPQPGSAFGGIVPETSITIIDSPTISYVPTNGDDVIVGGVNAESFFGNEGNDTIRGLGGNDRLFGEAGLDMIFGGPGNDFINGGIGADVLYGEAGVDEIRGDFQNDDLFGGDGDDLLAGGPGNDFLYGENGDDRLFGEDGNDAIYGGPGDDYVIGNAGDDFVSGGEGNDRVQGREGDDRVFGEEGDDELNGGSGNDRLIGNQGNDTLLGGDGNDDLQGREGNDTLNPGVGNDRLVGGDGFDTADYSSFSQGVIVNLPDGTVDKGAFGSDVVSSIEAYRGGSGTDQFIGTDGADIFFGGDAFDFFNAGAGNDIIYGEGGNDRIFALDGDDVIFGGDGDDYIAGNDGNDLMYGGNGDDNLQGRAGDDIMFGEAGNDQFYGLGGDDFADGGDGDDFIAGYEGNDTLIGGAGNDRFFGMDDDDRLEGGDGDDFLIANAGNDTVFGDAGNDNLRGRAGDDYLSGGEGNDFIVADEGNDTLTGDGGFDTLFGGSGSDTFVFAGDWRRDTVADWDEDFDVIDLTALGLKGAGESTADAFAKLTLTQDGTTAIISVTGDTRNDIRLSNTDVSTLDASDFLFEAAPAASAAQSGSFDFASLPLANLRREILDTDIAGVAGAPASATPLAQGADQTGFDWIEPAEWPVFSLEDDGGWSSALA